MRFGQRPRTAPCAGSPAGHYFTRDRSAPLDRQWTCACGEVAPKQPGTRAAGQGLGWPT